MLNCTQNKTNITKYQTCSFNILETSPHIEFFHERERERERDSERKRGGERGKEGERESDRRRECASACVCMCVCIIQVNKFKKSFFFFLDSCHDSCLSYLLKHNNILRSPALGFKAGQA